jgi:hypothetical protein
MMCYSHQELFFIEYEEIGKESKRRTEQYQLVAASYDVAYHGEYADDFHCS